MKRKFAIGLLLSVFMAFFSMVGSAGAVALTLEDMMAHAVTTVGDKAFYGFGYLTVGSNTVPAADVAVVPLTTPANDPGLEFVSGWTVGPGQILDSQISFYVQAPASAPVDDVLLQFNGAARHGGSASVVETVWSVNPNGSLGNIVANLYVNADGTTQLTDTATFSQTYTTLFVIKDIAVNGGPAGSAAISFVTNRFSEVPLPSALLLLAPGVLGLVGLRKRFFG